MRSRFSVAALSLVLLLAVPVSQAQEKSDPAEPLANRTYCISDVGDGILAAGTTYGVLFYKVPDKNLFTKGDALSPPALKFRIPLPDSVNDLLWHNELLFVANGPHGVKAYKKGSTAGRFELVSEIDTGGAAISLAALGDHLFVAQGTMGLAAYDISTPGTPQELVTLDTEGRRRFRRKCCVRRHCHLCRQRVRGHRDAETYGRI